MPKVWQMPALPKMPKPTRLPDFESGALSTDAPVSVTSTGLKDLEATLLAMPMVARDAAGVEMSRILAEVIALAMSVYVPYQYGALHDSGDFDNYVQGSGVGITQLAAWFGGLSTREQLIHGRSDAPHDYALVQHEDPTFNHPIVGPVTNPQDKYLEKPFNIKVQNAAERVAKAVEEAWGGTYNPTPPPAADAAPNELDAIYERLKGAPAYPKYGNR